ncbi:hypothetical protein ABMX48_00050 [Streptomyces cavourensis]
MDSAEENARYIYVVKRSWRLQLPNTSRGCSKAHTHHTVTFRATRCPRS